MGRIIPYIMENKKSLKPPTSHWFGVLLESLQGTMSISSQYRGGHVNVLFNTSLPMCPNRFRKQGPDEHQNMELYPLVI
jgi:hypothetical protein